MGYSSLDTWQHVDGASDLLYELEESRGTSSFQKIVAKAIKDEGNCFNPAGFINLALLLEAGEISSEELGERNLFLILDKVIFHLEEVNDEYHDQVYVRLYHTIRRLLKKA